MKKPRFNRRLTTEKFIEKATARHGDTYLYHLVDYKFSNTKVDIVCRKHGTFSITPANHLFGQGCTRCGDAANGLSQRKTTKEFIEESMALFGNLYDYSLTEYITCKHKVKIKCLRHGIFEKTPSKHLSGQGCPHCTEHGFKTSRPASLYVLICENIIKIGITNRAVLERVRTIKKSSGKPFTVLHEFKFVEGMGALKLESRLLRELSSQYKQPDYKYDGYKESFYDVNLATLLNRIEELIAAQTKEQHSSYPASQEA